MLSPEERDRCQAVERYQRGESLGAICAALGYSRWWFAKWVKRSQSSDPLWYREASRRPHHSPTRSAAAVAELVGAIRQRLEAEGLFHGAQAIRWELEDLAVSPLPSLRTIGRLLVRQELTHRRPGRYQARGTRYPALRASHPGGVHQSDFVGPRYLRGPVRFYSLNSVDLATGRCAVEPLLQRAAQPVIDALWATWGRLGFPGHQQVDNEMVFYGSPTHPRGMGCLIRLCLQSDIEPWFIPLGEPWRNGVVEKFNDHWEAKFLRRVDMATEPDLARESRRFEQRHNTRYRYSKLGGRTPQAALAASPARLRFPATPEAPRHPLSKPDRGQYHLLRFVRGDGILDVFGEQFRAPPEARYEYVRLTVQVEHQRLQVFLDDRLIDEHDYRLR